MIRWITAQLGTAPYEQRESAEECFLLDVRDMVDRAGNTPGGLREKIQQGAAQLAAGNRVIVCCDMGMSRSNAVAAGILALHERRGFMAAVEQVLQTTGETQIKPHLIEAVGQAAGLLTASRPPERRGVIITGPMFHPDPALKTAMTEADLNPVTIEGRTLDNAALLHLAVLKHEIDAVVHLASPAVPHANEAVGQALVTLKNVLDVCALNGLYLIYLSSAEVFRGIDEGDVDEQTPLRPRSTIGQTHALAEHLIDMYREESQLRAVVLRPGIVYHQPDSPPQFLRTFARCAASGQPITTHRYHNGQPMLELLHLDDLRRAIILAMQRRPTGAVHLGSRYMLSTRRIAEYFVELTRSQSPMRELILDDRAGNVRLGLARAERELGWTPQVDPVQGLARYLQTSPANRKAMA